MGFLLSNVFGPEKDARFFFYVYNVVKILLSILSVTEYHSRVKYIISLDFAITPKHWQRKSGLIFVPPVLCVLSMLYFVILCITHIRGYAYQFRQTRCCICLCFGFSPF